MDLRARLGERSNVELFRVELPARALLAADRARPVRRHHVEPASQAKDASRGLRERHPRAAGPCASSSSSAPSPTSGCPPPSSRCTPRSATPAPSRSPRRSSPRRRCPASTTRCARWSSGHRRRRGRARPPAPVPEASAAVLALPDVLPEHRRPQAPHHHRVSRHALGQGRRAPAVLHRRLLHLRPSACGPATARARSTSSSPPGAASASSSRPRSPRSPRASGLPSRVVVGFTPGQLRLDSGDYVVHGRDAHAWAEVWFAGTRLADVRSDAGRSAPGQADVRRSGATTPSEIGSSATTTATTAPTSATTAERGVRRCGAPVPRRGQSRHRGFRRRRRGLVGEVDRDADARRGTARRRRPGRSSSGA